MSDPQSTNILLVVPFWSDASPYVPLGLGYLSTALARKGYSVRIIDCVKEKMDIYEFKVFLRSIAPPDFIGFTVVSAALKSVKRHLSIVSELYPATVTVIGGPHPTGAPKASLSYLREADFGFVGEAEIGLPLLVERIIEKSRIFYDIPGLIYRTDSGICVNASVNHSEIDDFGFPDWKLIKPNEYPEDAVAILTMRGCPCHCTFCATAAIHGKRLRMRSISSIIDEITLLTKDYGIKRLNITDDNFTANHASVTEFCRQIIERKIKIELVCDNGIRLDSVDEVMLRLMKRAGFSWVGVGIESGSAKILKRMKKGLSIEKARRGVELINRCGLKVWGFFIIGYPGETARDIKQTIYLAASLRMFNASFSTFLPIPGTEIYHQLLEEGRITEESDYENFTPRAAYYSDTISRERLLRLREYAHFVWGLRKHLDAFSESARCPSILDNLLRDRSFFRCASALAYKLLPLTNRFIWRLSGTRLRSSKGDKPLY